MPCYVVFVPKNPFQKLRHEKGYSEQEVSEIVSYVMEKERPHSRAWYRMNAIRNMTGSAKLEPKLDEKTNEVSSRPNATKRYTHY